MTGGAGFIGSHLVDALLARRDHVVVFDDFSEGKREFLPRDGPHLSIVPGDIRNAPALADSARGCDAVWHLAADRDVRTSAANPLNHVALNVTGTVHALEAARAAGAKKFVLTSSGTVYGETRVFPTPEDVTPMEPISLYGATKLADEALLSAYGHTFGLTTFAFRFANVVGPRSTHGVTADFVRKLRDDAKRLEILGNGKQSKSYVSVADTVAAMLAAFDRAPPRPFTVLNIGSDDAIDVTAIARLVSEEMGLKDVRFDYTGGDRGWVGDVRVMRLATDRLRALGWRPKHTSAEAVRIAARALLDAER
ncbi:MAG: NAD-dependent epimerase/dehydratase family protein [Thermoplasmatota archaeon]